MRAFDGIGTGEGWWGIWHRATLKTSGHCAPGGTIDAASDGTGVFLYRDSPGTGNVSYAGVALNRDYAVDGLSAVNTATVSVHAIEMVYVPEGPFEVGDGTSQ